MLGQRVGMVGAGKMAGSLIQAWVQGGVLQSSQVMASVPVQDKHLLEPLERLGCLVTHSNKEVVSSSDIIMLGVKPNIIPLVARELRDQGRGDQLLVSIAAGLDIDTIQEQFGGGWKVIRVMPNTAVSVGEGATVYCLGEGAKEEDAKLIETLFSSVGLCDRVKESQMDAVTGVSGSGPAYMYLVIEAMADEGVRQGLEREIAYRLAAQTMLGAGKMVLSTGKHPGQLKDEVTSPGGSTIAALHWMEKAGVRGAMMGAVAAAAGRCKEINGK